METVGKQEKTKYKLAASMKECMKQMPVDKITVKNIVEGCGVARQTFYRNFLDKFRCAHAVKHCFCTSHKNGGHKADPGVRAIIFKQVQ